MVDVAKGIVTFGLGGDQSNMVLGYFNLGFLGIEIIIPPREGGAGGASVRPFPDRTKSWDEDISQSIIIRITFRGETTEKLYLVSAKRTEFIIQVMNIINTTRARIKIAVSNLKRRTLGVFAKFKNLSTKDDEE